MSLQNDPLKESSTAHSHQSGQEMVPQPTPEVALDTTIGSAPRQSLSGSPSPDFRFGKRWVSINGTQAEVFTLTFAGETIELLPLKNWSQLDVHKWRARGQLPGTPTGLEIALDHIKFAGEEFYSYDVNVCKKLEKRFAEWLKLEQERQELLKKEADRKLTPSKDTGPRQEQPTLHFEVDVDKSGQVHIRCIEGKATAATIGLTGPGFQSLVNQRLMRKPHSLKIGVLHDWVELEGVLYSFKDGNNDAEKLARALNQNFLAASALHQGDSIVIFENAATATGLEMQFEARVGGVPDHQRRPLDQATLELLQDPERCGLLQPGIVVKLAAPHVIFKRRTPDGGEDYLCREPQNQVKVIDQNGEEKTLDLSQPLDYMRLNPAELTAAFNHPAVNRVQNAVPQPHESAKGQQTSAQPAVRAPATMLRPAPTGEASAKSPPPKGEPEIAGFTGTSSVAQTEPLPEPKGLPNLWLRLVLEQPSLQHEWIIWLVYAKIADAIGNSQKAKFDDSECWLISLNGVEEATHPDFKGIFLIENQCLGFSSAGHMTRFEAGTMLIGPRTSILKARDVHLLAVGMDSNKRLVFIVSDGYRAKFGQPEQTVAAVLDRLKEQGAVVVDVKEAIVSREPIDVAWTVPAAQANPNDPQAVESRRSMTALNAPGTAAGDGIAARQAA